MAESQSYQGLLPISPPISPTREVLEGENRRDSAYMESLRSVARWCLHQYRGILTPTGRQKKPPTFQIVMCEKGHIGLTSSKVAKAQRYKCTEYVMKRKAVPAFNTYDVKPMKCDLDTEVIETIKEEL